MDNHLCAACNNVIPSEHDNTEEDSELYSYCIPRKIAKQMTKSHLLARTSTPIQEVENNAPSTSTDSVNEFFYQSWKNGLQPTEPTPNPEQFQVAQPVENQPPMCNVTQVIFVNTVFVQPVIPQMVIMPDGTLGVLPTFLPYNVNYI